MKKPLGTIQAEAVQLGKLIEGCAAELAKLESVIAHELASRRLPAVMGGVLAKHRALRGRLAEAHAALGGIERTIEGAIGEQRALDARLETLVEQEEAARRFALSDPLTGVASPVLFRNRLDHGLEQARRRNWTLAVMVLDIERLGAVNDLLGREAGDEVLRTIARRLRVATRGEDTVGRGDDGEFFYLLMDFRDAENVAMIAERFVCTITEPCEVSTATGRAHPAVTVSIGVAIYPRDGATASALVASAQNALAKAKQRRTSVAFAS
jgi:diguanylate cyclase (GGDEF)-like protein